MLEKQTTDQKTAADILFKGRRERQRKNMPIFIAIQITAVYLRNKDWPT